MPAGQTSPRGRRAAAGLAVAAGLALTGCGQAPPNPVKPGATSSTAAPSTSASAAVNSSRPLAPLTGLPAASTADAAKPAVALVVSGDDPQGLTSADVVFEEITDPVRYIAVYQSRPATTVGPITTTQPTDREALAVLHPLIGYDGAVAAFFIKLLDQTKITDAGYSRYPALYASTPEGLTTTPQAITGSVTGDTAPQPLFQYRDPGSAGTLAGSGQSRPASAAITIPGLGTQDWTFDQHTDRWTLTSGGPAAQVANLIIQTVPYTTVNVHPRRGVYVSTAGITGTGRAEILSGATSTGNGGTAAAGTWSKPHTTQVTNYFDSSGTPMTLQPGPTWIILAPAGTQVTTTGAHQ